MSTQALLLVSALLLGAWSPSLLIPEIVLELLEQVLMGTHPLTPSTNIIGASISSRSSTIGNPSSPPPNQFLVPASSPVCSPSPEWQASSSTLTCFTSYSRISSYNNHPPKLLIFMRILYVLGRLIARSQGRSLSLHIFCPDKVLKFYGSRRGSNDVT